MKSIFYGTLAILFCLTWSCNDEVFSTPIPLPNEVDDTVSVVVPLTYMIIEEIEIERFPRRMPDGARWDFFEDDWPDFYVSIRDFGATAEKFSDTLENNALVQDYSVVSNIGRCYVSTENAVLLDGTAHLTIPVNFQGEISLLDLDAICAGLGFSGCGYLGLELRSFSLTLIDYVAERPREILLTNEDGCRYVLRLAVRWI